MQSTRPLVLLVLALWSFGVCAQGRGVRLGDLSWPDAEVRLAESPLVIIPFGAGDYDARVAENSAWLRTRTVAAIKITAG